MTTWKKLSDVEYVDEDKAYGIVSMAGAWRILRVLGADLGYTNRDMEELDAFNPFPTLEDAQSFYETSHCQEELLR